VVYFAVVIDLQSSSSSSSAAAASSSLSADSGSSCDQPLAWVISRQLKDFLGLRQQLLKVAFIASKF